MLSELLTNNLGGGYYINQNGVPFIASQQSFGNINSAGNKEGITDGVSNPLDQINDEDDSDNGGDAGSVQISDHFTETENAASNEIQPEPADPAMTVVTLDTPEESLI